MDQGAAAFGGAHADLGRYGTAGGLRPSSVAAAQAAASLGFGDEVDSDTASRGWVCRDIDSVRR